MFTKILIANRGEIACRIIKTLKKMNIQSVVVYTTADIDSLHVSLADEAYLIGEGLASESYLDYKKILAIAKESGAQAVHPGYGFLSENAKFVDSCIEAGIVFIGPTTEHMKKFGLKHTARELAEDNYVPLLPGSSILKDLEEAKQEALRIVYPVMLKSTAGGGGIGMQLCYNEEELCNSYDSVKRLSENNFSDGGMFLEKYVTHARHIEVQIFGDGKGFIGVLGDRDCSVQRRNQKVIEETPAPNLSNETREALYSAAKKLTSSVSYLSAGTVEFVYDTTSSEFYFLEVNTRLQVEHGITEEVSGVDLVEWMVRQAYGTNPELYSYEHNPKGHSIEVRIYAEDPAKNFQPSSGTLTNVSFADDIRCDTFIETGLEISAFYDPMIAKLIIKAENRENALVKMNKAIEETRVDGIETNLRYLGAIVKSEVFEQGLQTTKFLNTFEYAITSIDVLRPGTQTAIQDYPGRLGYWDIGVPPSGPFDMLSFRYANRIVGNSEDAAGLEIAISGPTLKFNSDTVFSLCGAPIDASLDGEEVLMNKAITIKAGSILKLKKVSDEGFRTYLAVRGGFDVPKYLGSRSTFTLGQFGGHAGRTLLTGDVLHLDTLIESEAVSEMIVPHQEYSKSWKIGVLYGPHGAPDFFTKEDIETFFATDWKIHYNSNRTGIRLIGPKPAWARTDGGEAGLHPSNIHDNAYAIGAVDFTGDMPVILGPDGPSLGGFVCPVTIVTAELWKLGQLRAGDKVTFVPLEHDTAMEMLQAQEDALENLETYDEKVFLEPKPIGSPILYSDEGEGDLPSVVMRQSGDSYLLIEYGEMQLEISLRFRVHVLMQAIKSANIKGIIDVTPGIRSLQLHFDPKVCKRDELMEKVKTIELTLPLVDDIEVPARIVHLPLSWDDESTRVAIDKYMKTVRPDAPWCPSNIEFIRRINGLDSIQEVKDIVFGANYLVMGLGDVYLGAPVATPLDPRQRLVTTKYNPARTWTPENAVGIGGAYMCVYGMEGPGGYQFVGRTVQMWNRHRQTKDFIEEKPWLLRFFDQIKFYEVSADELHQMREDFPRGRMKLKTEETTFSLKEYKDFLDTNNESINEFKKTQQDAFEEERQMWERTGLANFNMENSDIQVIDEEKIELAQNAEAVESPVQGSLWKVMAKVGDTVAEGDVLAIAESMKMEIDIDAPENGKITHVLCSEGENIQTGKMLFVIEPI
ncbi:urea carboxylase [Sulfurimonas aquatica]|uniref:Urea carboxylase n=1 Tax=Sulfurimonas aquatica TaxID=2672570 RepID=A0A975AY06_9BACT|nr:urea carboxylase [Sulfurimonas aquatica]QSZ40654.1 urea carboxylase [Sulfurimonas aquatica]